MKERVPEISRQIDGKSVWKKIGSMARYLPVTGPIGLTACDPAQTALNAGITFGEFLAAASFVTIMFDKATGGDPGSKRVWNTVAFALGGLGTLWLGSQLGPGATPAILGIELAGAVFVVTGSRLMRIGKSKEDSNGV